MQKLDKIKRPNNYFFCCQLNDLTKKMFQIMKENFKNLEISQMESKTINYIEFSNYVAFTLRTSYARSLLKIENIKQKVIRFKASFIMHNSIEPVQSNHCNGINYFSNYLSQFGKKKIGGDTILEIQANELEINNRDKGTSCSIFEAFDIRNNLKVVIKLPKEVITQINKKKQLDESVFKEAQKSAFVKYNQMLIAQQLSSAYRNETKLLDFAPPIFYVTPIKYKLCNEFYGVTELYAETYISIEGPWEKISNNTDYIDYNKHSYSAFSHFTHYFTNEVLVINDLQGKAGIFSDPSIQTKDDIQYLRDKTNLGQEGIANFFLTQHRQCNQICQMLKLPRQDYFNEKKPILKLNILNIEKINAVCVVCGDIFQSTKEQYRAIQDNQVTCQNCLEINEISEICECCSEEFKFNLNNVLKKALNVKKCHQCIKNCVTELCAQCAFSNKSETLCQKCQTQIQCFYCKTQCVKKQVKSHIFAADGQQKDICQEAFRFFENLYCSKCNKSFQYLQWPSQEEYIKGEYYCFECQKQ